MIDPQPEMEHTTMRFMIIVKADKSTEAGVLPDEKLLAAMTRYNEELVRTAGKRSAGAGPGRAAQQAAIEERAPCDS